MAIYNICVYGRDPVLKEVAKEVPKITPNIHKLLDNMLETMYHADGVGLAAPQVGVSKRVIVIDVGQGPIELINPAIIAHEGTEQDVEGCLSVPGRTGQVRRHAKIKVKGLNRHGEETVIEAEGLLSRAFQHEIDHLNGILFVEREVK